MFSQATILFGHSDKEEKDSGTFYLYQQNTKNYIKIYIFKNELMLSHISASVFGESISK